MTTNNEDVNTSNDSLDYDDKLSQYDEVALLLSGGGALGSYQAGVLESFINSGIEPTWIAGISIGALNSAIFAGNRPEKRLEMLHKFWNTVCTPPVLPVTSHMFANFFPQLTDYNKVWTTNFEAARSMLEGKQGFFTPRFPLPLISSPDKLSLYDITKLKATLLECADFDLINSGKMRVSVGAVNVASGEFVYFDNTKDTLQPEHFMASGAVPPSFPAVEIDGQYYWDGSLMSNTPLTEILKEDGHKNKLIFQIELWHAEGKLPTNIQDVMERKKDLDSSGKTIMVTELLLKEHKNAHMMSNLLSCLSPDDFQDNAIYRKAQTMAKPGLINIIQLTYHHKDYEGHTKDHDFSFSSMQERWNVGLSDMKETLENLQWLDLPNLEEGVVIHKFHKEL